jgi:hypothetical protein
MFEKSDAATRIKEARRVTSRLIDHVHYLLDIHENNRIILFSDTLSKQIPKSFAANAFNVFREAMHQIELVRLCALWDQAHLDNETIPTVVELIDNTDVLAMLVQEIADHHAKSPVSDLGSLDGETAEVKEQIAIAIRERQAAFGNQQAEKGRAALAATISGARSLQKSDRMKSLRNLRNKHVAHYLVETRAEKESGPIALAKYGDERKVLDDSVTIVENLYCWVNGTSLSLADSRTTDRKCAEALWKACTFKLEDRTSEMTTPLKTDAPRAARTGRSP